MHRTMVRRLLVTVGLLLAPAAASAAPAHAPCTERDLAGDLKTVIAECQALIDTNTLKGEDLAETLRFQGDAYFRSNRVDLAFENYERALALKPDWPLALWNRGNAASVLGDIDLDMRSQRRALEVDPGFSRAHNAIGTILVWQGDREGAIREYDKALSLDPKNYHARFNRAAVYQDEGRALDAVHEYDALLAEDEAEVNATYVHWRRTPGKDFIGVVRMQRASALVQIGALDEAIDSLAEAIARKPDYVDAVIARSELIRSGGSDQLYGEALASIDEAERLVPQGGMLALEKARILKAMGDSGGARAILEASSSNESSAGAQFFIKRSNAWEDIREFDRAIADLRRAMMMDEGTFNAAASRMLEVGYLMEMPGLDPETALDNAIAACVRDPFC